MATLSSTLPGAISALQAHMTNVANANTNLNVGVYIGPPIGDVTNNFLMVGNALTNNELVTAYRQNWAGLPASVGEKIEEYSIPCSVRVWDGNSDPLSRITDLFTLIDGLLTELQDDPQATISGGYPLTPSGSWQVSEVTIPESGPIGNKGWGIVATFNVEVINVRIFPES